MTIDRAVARKNKDWGNIHGWIPRLAIQGLYDDYVETKHCQDQTLNDWGKCLGLPHTGYGPESVGNTVHQWSDYWTLITSRFELVYLL